MQTNNSCKYNQRTIIIKTLPFGYEQQQMLTAKHNKKRKQQHQLPIYKNQQVKELAEWKSPVYLGKSSLK